MSTLRAALIPGLISGIVSILTSWLWMGVIFHRYQRETPQTWRPEGGSSYLAASVLHVVAAMGISCLAVLMIRFHVGIFAEGIVAHLRLAFCLWIAIALPIFLEWAVFIRLHPLVVVGQLLDWLTTSIVACGVTGWWLSR
jgi:hypothetical protein